MRSGIYLSYLYLRENREIILLCEIYCYKSKNCSFSIELNGTVVASGYSNKDKYGNTNYEFITNRKDNHNIYTCSRDGHLIEKTELIINYPPSVDVRLRNDIAAIDCVADGNPDTYNFYQWEHMSFYGGHIRYLDGLANGTLILGNDSIEDTGIYICEVSNGVRDENENLRQNGSTVFKYYGPPVFVTKKANVIINENRQTVFVTFNIYSNPMIDELWICGTNGNIYNISVKNYKVFNETLAIKYYGVTSDFQGLRVFFSTRLLQSGFYNVFARNPIGEGHCDLEIISFNEKIQIRLELMICGTLLGVCIVYLIISHIAMCRKRTSTATIDLYVHDRHEYDEIGTIHYHVGNVLNPAQETEQNDNIAISSSNQNVSLAANDNVDETESKYSENQSTSLSASNSDEREGNISDSHLSSSSSEVGDGFLNPYEATVTIHGRINSHVYAECNAESNGSEIPPEQNRQVEYVNLKF